MRNIKKRKYILGLIFVFSGTACRQFFGDTSLGHNFHLLGGDRKEDRIIVYSTNKDYITYSGINVVPYSERQFDNGAYYEYVEYASSNAKWIIARTYVTRDHNSYYYIINKDLNLDNLDCNNVNCDSIIKAHV